MTTPTLIQDRDSAKRRRLRNSLFFSQICVITNQFIYLEVY